MKSHRMFVMMMVVGVGGFLAASPWVFGAEHGGTETKEHGGAASTTQAHDGATQEHGGQAVQAEPSAEQIRQAIEDYVQGQGGDTGAFEIEDEVAGATRQLEFVRVHERVGKTGDLYYSCTDMRDTQTGELLDLDFDVNAEGGGLSVVDQRIHKVNNQARYTYDENDNRMPLPGAEHEQTP